MTNSDWFNGAVSKKGQTPDYILPRMALTMVQPGHRESLKGCCHRRAAMALVELHNEDRLTQDDKIVMLGLGSTIYHTILLRKDGVLYDSMGGEEGFRYDSANERYFYGNVSGHLEVKHAIPVDDFFTNYVANVKPSVPSPDDPKPDI